MEEEKEEMDAATPQEGEVIEVKPLTEKEKAERLKQAEERIKQRKIEIHEEEKKQEIEREKDRRKTGQDLTKIKADMEWKEAQKLAEERKREKREDRLARQRVLEEIAQDRANMKAKQTQNKQHEKAASINPKAAEREERQRIKDQIAQDRENAKAQRQFDKDQHAASGSSKEATKPVSETVTKNYSEAKLQIRFPDNTKLIQSFGADEPLSAVRLFIDLNGQNTLGPFIDLSVPYPRKIFSGDELQMPLRLLGLVPSAVILVSKGKDPASGTAI